VIVRLDAVSPVPPYEQLRAQIAASIGAGSLAPGHRLPPIRQLAADLELAPGTVARAYRELEVAGLVVSRGRRGTRVADAPPAPDPDERAARLDRAADDFALRAAELGVEPDEAMAAVSRALGALAP
jgi:GntR family transcriptional regulator